MQRADSTTAFVRCLIALRADGLGKAHRLVHIVKDSVVLTHKRITKDPLGSGLLKVNAHKGQQASSLRLSE